MAYEVTEHPLTGVEARPGQSHYAIFDHGAHAWAWQPDGQRPVLWLSAHSRFASGQAVRGGVPVIFPWFGTGPAGDRQPAHGFGRLQAWNRRHVADTTDTDGRLVVELELDPTMTGEQPDFPFSYSAGLQATFTPQYLQVALEVRNTDTTDVTFEAALHTYLAVSDVRQVSLHGLDGVHYLDRTATATALPVVQRGPVTITAETDRIYQEHPAVTLHDPGWTRSLTISDEGAANLVVWNPWVAKAAAMADFGDDEWTGMICVESANVLDHAITLEPGESHRLSQRVTLG